MYLYIYTWQGYTALTASLPVPWMATQTMTDQWSALSRQYTGGSRCRVRGQHVIWPCHIFGHHEPVASACITRIWISHSSSIEAHKAETHGTRTDHEPYCCRGPVGFRARDNAGCFRRFHRPELRHSEVSAHAWKGLFLFATLMPISDPPLGHPSWAIANGPCIRRRPILHSTSASSYPADTT